MKSTIKRILREEYDKGLTLSTFNNLPYEYKRSLMTYMVSGEPVEWTEDVPSDPSLIDWYNEDVVNDIIEQYTNVHGNKKFLYGIMNTNDIIKGIKKYDFDWDDFNEYHQWYQADNPYDHTDSLFPIMLSSDKDLESGGEYIEDGWHRFHSYIKNGITNIPVIKFV